MRESGARGHRPGWAVLGDGRAPWRWLRSSHQHGVVLSEKNRIAHDPSDGVLRCRGIAGREKSCSRGLVLTSTEAQGGEYLTVGEDGGERAIPLLSICVGEA